jgi:hypothetical protein
MSADAVKGVHIISDQGAEMMTLEKFGRDGDRMTVQGSLMGAWSSTMFVDPADVFPMIGLLLNWEVIGYMFSLPWILMKNKRKG